VDSARCTSDTLTHRLFHLGNELANLGRIHKSAIDVHEIRRRPCDLLASALATMSKIATRMFGRNEGGKIDDTSINLLTVKALDCICICCRVLT
jgi:hypothetical protein